MLGIEEEKQTMTTEELYNELKQENVGRCVKCTQTGRVHKIIRHDNFFGIGLSKYVSGSPSHFCDKYSDTCTFEWYTPELTLEEVLTEENAPDGTLQVGCKSFSEFEINQIKYQLLNRHAERTTMKVYEFVRSSEPGAKCEIENKLYVINADGQLVNYMGHLVEISKEFLNKDVKVIKRKYTIQELLCWENVGKKFKGTFDGNVCDYRFIVKEKHMLNNTPSVVYYLVDADDGERCHLTHPFLYAEYEEII